jgi:hypothetical protein
MARACRAGVLAASAALALGLAGRPVNAQVLAPHPDLRWSLSYETWSLPRQERLGMAGGRVMMDLGPRWQLGVASYGALSGQRGGFITLGAEALARWPLSESLDLTGQWFLGAGGGRDGRSLAGGGLMLRSSLGLEQRLGSAHRIGLGLSRVDFPDGRIASSQPYLSYAHSFPSLLWPGWPELPAPVSSAPEQLWAQSEQEFALVARSYRFAAGVTQDTGLRPQHPSMQLLGAQWLGYVQPDWFLKLESEGAAGGQSAGYMQILLGGGYRWPLPGGQSLKLHASLGPAGGGAADTGGGLLTDLGLAWQLRLSPRQSLELSASEVRAPGRSFHARSLGLRLVHHLRQPQASGAPLSPQLLAGLDAERLRLRWVQQTYLGDDPQWRCCHPDLAVHNLGLQLDRMSDPGAQGQRWFLTGQGIAAYWGEAGAYMTGLVGAGWLRPLSPRWFTQAEALVGAAGGGGLSMGGGLVGQVNLGLGYQLGPQWDLLLTAGRMQAWTGPFKAHVLGFGAVYRFSALTRSS